MLRIDLIAQDQFEKLLPLIGEYQKFYRQTPSLERNRIHFGRYLIEHEEGVLFGASVEGKLVGFCTLYFLPSSLSASRMCVLNDLYTLPEYRGQGVARALVARGQEHAKKRGFSNIEWWTEQSNHAAQRLYDQLGAERSAWYLYSLSVTGGR